MNHPALSLDDLATAWLPRRMTQLAAMPGLNNDLGSVQIEADIAAVKHPVFPPYSGGNEITWITLLNGRQLAQLVPEVHVRWRAFEVERRCEAEGWKLESRTSLLPAQPGVVVKIAITNTRDQPRPFWLGFICSGRAMNTGKEGYAWAVPSIPTDVFSFTKVEGLMQTVSVPALTDTRCLANETGDTHNVHCVSPSPTHWDRERIPTWEKTLAPGESFEVTLFCSFHADEATAIEIASEWKGRTDEVFSASRKRWEALWASAFTPHNALFSGHMPVLESPNPAMLNLYYMAVLTLLTCRRLYYEAVMQPCYLTLWPRRGEGSGYLAWDINCISGVLARLDPAALRSHWLLLASAPWLDYQVTNFFTGGHGGWACSAQPQSLLTGAANLLRWAGDASWETEPVERKSRETKGFEAASQGQVVDGEQAAVTETLSGLEVLRQALFVHRTHHLPGKSTIDFGSRAAYLECISTYTHGTAGHTAIQAWALETFSSLAPGDNTKEIQGLKSAVMDLYNPTAGYFDCEYPDGSRHRAANLYDIGLVLRHIGDSLDPKTLKEVVGFVRCKLLTPTWTHCLDPADLDVNSGIRCDHQWAGCFSGWPPLFVLGVLRSGERGEWIGEWLEGVAKVTAQGPFSQAYWAEDLYPAESGAAAKCFDELTQGNHWVISSGALFAEMILDGICGLSADLEGNLTLRPGLESWAKDAAIHNISVHGQAYDLLEGRLVRTPQRSG
ncbi:MAG: hypothetical protein WCH98_12675 [Verrucomicrobiota bacterium]